MYGLSPEAQKAQENANTRRQVQEAHADRGPYLSDDSEMVIIPSPARHDKFKRVLRAYGFKFEWYDIPGPMWTRPTNKPHKGKRYTPNGWLEWSRRMYAKAWPKWKATE